MEELERLTRKLNTIKGKDPVSRARRAALIRAVFELQQLEG